MINKKLPIPKPGSESAINRGCTCPVIDNHYGRGIPGSKGREFWYSEDCLLHNPKKHEAKPLLEEAMA